MIIFKGEISGWIISWSNPTGYIYIDALCVFIKSL